MINLTARRNHSGLTADDICHKVHIIFSIVQGLMMDPLSDVLSLLKPFNYMSAGFDASGEWAIQFPDQQKNIKCGAVVLGDCWLSVEGVADPVHLQQGDGFVLPSGRPFRLASDLSLPAVNARDFFNGTAHGGIATWRDGGDCIVVSSRFNLRGNHAQLLLGLLPPIVHIQKEFDQGSLRGLVEGMMVELRKSEPGGGLIIQHLAHMILVQALRLYISDAQRVGTGWLFALRDKQIGAAISSMHANPAYRWTLQELASHVGMSRSSLALKFKSTVGQSPMEYLTQWRMLLAGERLTNSKDSIAVISSSLGYESESAFSTSFKKVMGCSPRKYGAVEMET